ncbi:MAG: Crp/Fnr family transcriptional regulator [Sphingomicrobium sp.]
MTTLSPADVAMLERMTSRPRDYAAKQDIIREGDRPGPVFIVLEGWACCYKILPSGSRQIMAFMLPGDACNLHVGMLARMDHSLQAITPAKVAPIPGDEMATILNDYPRIAAAMYKSQLIDEGTLRAWIVSMGRRSSIERVAHLMCELYLRTIVANGIPDDEVSLPISQIIFADALGMTPVHINRILRELREAGAMAFSRGSLKVIDPVKLVQIAGFDENYLHRREKQQLAALQA